MSNTNPTDDRRDARDIYEKFLGRANDARNSLNDAQWAQVAAAQTAFKQVWAAGPDDARLDAAEAFQRTVRSVLNNQTAPTGSNPTLTDLIDQMYGRTPAPGAPAPAQAPTPAPVDDSVQPGWVNSWTNTFLAGLDETRFQPIRADIQALAVVRDDHEDRLTALEEGRSGFNWKMFGAVFGAVAFLWVVVAFILQLAVCHTAFGIAAIFALWTGAVAGGIAGTVAGALTRKKVVRTPRETETETDSNTHA